MQKDVKNAFIRIFAVSLAVTLLLSPAPSFSHSQKQSLIYDIQAEEEPITDTQRGIALLMTILFAQGLRFVGDWDTVVQPGLSQLWEDFSTATGNAVTVPMIVAGSSLALGYIRTSNTVNNAINNFMTWYRTTYNQPNTGSVEITISSGGGSAIYEAPRAFTQIGTYNGSSFSIYGSRTGINVCNVIGENGSFYIIAWDTSSSGYVQLDGAFSSAIFLNNSSAVVDGVTYYGGLFTNVGNVSFTDSLSGYTGVSSFSALLPWVLGASSSLGDIALEGQSLELKDGYQLESDQAKLYDIAGLEALVASLALTLENIDDLVRDIPLIFDTPWAEDFPDVPAYVDTPDDTIPWVDVPDSVIPADTPEYVPTIPSERDEYKILGLEQVFPFSIPFDLYYLTQVLVHEPETPSFTYAVVNPVNGQLISMELDLSDFDGIAGICRTIETILFIAFLIYITRSLIRS